MSVKTNAHIISHTHWDREWFLNSPYTNEWLVPFFDSLFSLLEREPEYRFVLDGQTCIIEDYLDQLKKEGKDHKKGKELLKKYVSNKQLFVGPYYLQLDWQLVSEEALIRNLLIGHKVAEKYGGVMKTGWLLDNFGQVSQTVQIHNKFDLKGLFVWRGVEMDPENVRSEFLWQSPDGSKLTSVYFLSSYRNAMRLGEYENILKERVSNEVKKISPFASTSNVLLMNGYDQEMVPDDMLSHIKNLSYNDISVKQSVPEEYIEAIEKGDPELELRKGALYSGRFISVFPGILSARVYLKLLNDRGQKQLERFAEPLSVMTFLNGQNYDRESLLHSWKLLAQNHPHDSICGVSIDDVHSDMEERFAESYKVASSITVDNLSLLTSNIDTQHKNTDTEPYVIYNTLSSARSGIIEISLKDKTFNKLKVLDPDGYLLPYQLGSENNVFVYLPEIPASGYKTIYFIDDIKEEYNDKDAFLPDELKIKGNIIENTSIRVSINSNGTFNILHKPSQTEYKNLGLFLDSADAGDEYNYSPCQHDQFISNEDEVAKVEFVEKGPIKSEVKVDVVLKVPATLSPDRNTRSNNPVKLPVTTWISIEAGSEIVKCITKVKNTCKDHRLRVHFPSNIDCKSSFAGTQFDITQHKIIPEILDNDKIPEEVKRIIIGAREAEDITNFPYRYFVDLNDSQKGMAILSKGLNEYEVIPENNTIALTLFRSVGWLARGDLISRIGDAGPTMYTPEAQCLREMTFEYAVCCHKGNHIDAAVYNTAYDYNTDLLTVKTDQHSGPLKKQSGFLSLKSKNSSLQVTAIKPCEEEEAVIARLFNTCNEQVEGVIESEHDINAAYLTNLNEDNITEISLSNKKAVTILVKPSEIVTLKLCLNRKKLLNNKLEKSELLKTSLESRYKTSFDNYKYQELVTLQDIESEEKRYNALADELNSEKQRSEDLKTELKMKNLNEIEYSRLEIEYQKCVNNIASLNRSSLEAKLSMILTRKKYLEYTGKIDTPEGQFELSAMDKIIREIGYKLNEYRVTKRVYEYIVEYYEHRLKLKLEKVAGA